MRHVIKYCRWCHRQELWRHNLYFKRPRVAIFADIIKIITMFIKRIFKDSKNVKRIRNYVSRFNLYLYFLIYQNLLISGEKSLISAEPKVCVTWFMYFLNHLLLRYECAKFHHYMMYVTDFLGRGWPFCHSPPSHPWAAPKRPILNRVKRSPENSEANLRSASHLPTVKSIATSQRAEAATGGIL